MLATEEFLYGSGVPRVFPTPVWRWLRPVLQWFGVGLAHAALLGLVLQFSPQARQAFGTVIEASLIAPRPLPVEAPPAPPASFLVPEAPAETVSTAASTAAPTAAVAAPALAASAAAVPLSLVPPVFNADYLDNPAPPYPPASRRLGERGRVVLRVLVSAEGRAEHVEVHASSGFVRLDLAAREAVANWRFVPARRGSEQVAAWVMVPVAFVM